MYIYVMNRTAEIVNKWVEFESRHPDANIHDFYRYELIKEREGKKSFTFLGGVIPPKADQILVKILDRIIKIHGVYNQNLLRNIGIGGMDEFLYLNNVQHLENLRKIDIINTNFNELSSGLLIIERLIKKGLLVEMPDPNDKRSKLMELTDLGKEKLNACYSALNKLNEVIFNHLEEDELSLCIQMLKPIETKFSSLCILDKKLDFEEVYNRELNS